MYVLDTASAAYVHDKTLVRRNGATPILLFSGVTFMIGVAWAARYVRRAGSWQLPSALLAMTRAWIQVRRRFGR